MIMDVQPTGDGAARPKPRIAATCMSWCAPPLHKNVVVAHTTTYAAKDFRPGRRIWLRSHSGLGPSGVLAAITF